jgi:hypothetical protein
VQGFQIGHKTRANEHIDRSKPNLLHSRKDTAMQSDDSARDARWNACSDAIGAEASDGTSPRSSKDQRRAALIRTIEGAIVPRLLMVRRSTGLPQTQIDSNGLAPEPADVAEFARLILAHGPAMACEFVETLRQQGAPFDRICLDLIAPTAQHLLELCEQQSFGAAELTSGLNALHAVLIEISGAARSGRGISRGQ